MPNNVLQFPFPKPSPGEKGFGRIVFEIGIQRFAIDYSITDLDQEETTPLEKKHRKNKRPAKGIQRTPRA